MAVELLGTSVALSFDASATELTMQVFADLKDGDEQFRVGGPMLMTEFVPGENVTSQLLEETRFVRDNNLGDVLGDLRRNHIRVSRWDFYAAPFHVELDDELRRLVDVDG
jgi:hypothetical protein